MLKLFALYDNFVYNIFIFLINMNLNDTILALIDPEHNKSLSDLGVLSNLDSNTLCVTKRFINKDEAAFRNLIASNMPTNLNLEIKTQVNPRQPVAAIKHNKITNVVAIMSGKGGVGKSTVSANLAVELVNCGFKVGLLDADIHGPSQILMMGGDVNQADNTSGAICHGVQVVSMGSMLPVGSPAAWRGPMASKVLTQLYQQTNWDNLDFLLIDCPPGTSDILMTLAKDVPIVGAILVTTPQVASVMDAERAGGLMQKLQVPILGVLENMSQSVCPACSSQIAMFGQDGGKVLAQRLNVDFWGSVPLQASVCKGGEAGRPIALDSDLFRSYAPMLVSSLNKLPRYKNISSIKVVTA